MNEEQYISICEACDRILNAHDSTDERVAISWLHVVREHPVFICNYKEVLRTAKSIKSIGRKWLKVVRNRVSWLLQLAKAVISDEEFWLTSKQMSENVDFLFVSHLNNESQAKVEEDFYFGHVPNELDALGYSVAIILINSSGRPAVRIASKCESVRVPRIILSDSIGISNEIGIRSRLKVESSSLKLLAKREQQGLFRRVLEQASEECLSGSTHQNMRMAKQIGSLVEKLQPKAIVITHEGHAWERLVFSSARRAHPDVLCIGYQHAAVFRLQHAMRRCLAPKYNPDQILAAGDISRIQLNSSLGLKGIPISVFGSNRRSARKTMCPDRLIQTHLRDSSIVRTCLVLPEGIASECHLMFEFSILCAIENPDVQFIWRLHPAVSFESLKNENPKLRTPPKNIILSQTSLEVDVSRSHWALYRGTTAIVQAVVGGLQPIYLQTTGELNIDPLYEIDVWRVSVSDVSEFHRVISPCLDVSNSQSELDIEQAQKYCEMFFTPLDISKLITMVGRF